MAEAEYTPMMQQYLAVKKNYPDALVFYRIGDFYEMFFDDAKTASRELDLVLTGKNAGTPERVPMCGVPFHAVQPYLQRLVTRGYKVAIVEQMEDPALARGLVKRDVIRVVTPGTAIEEISDDRQSVYLAAVEDYGYGYAVAVCEASTGENYVQNVAHSNAELCQCLLRNSVREVVLKEGFDARLIRTFREMQIVISWCDETAIKDDYLPLGEKLTRDYDRAAWGRMLNYLEATQKHMMAHLSTVTIENEENFLVMDYATRINLEISEPLHRQNRSETLWSFLDQCRSAMGSRLLRRWLEKPLVDEKEITKRYDRLEALRKNFMVRTKLRDHLGGIYDLQRLIARCAMNSAGPQDLVRLSRTLNEVPAILDSLPDAFAQYQNTDRLEELACAMDGAFVENPPATLSEGGVFADGYNADLDEARKIQNSGREFISSMEAKEKERTGIKTLKIGYNKVFGYYIEVSKGAAAGVKEEWGWIRKQTLVNNERYISPELKEKEEQILHAEENAVRLEKQLFASMLEEIKTHLPAMQKLAMVLSEIDCIQSFAEVSAKYGYVRPEFSSDALNITNGRHPILDARMKDPRYVKNSIEMDKAHSILLITGPNMGGKSTYMRQTALIVIMAQAGCYVPADSCTMPVFDKIFTRIGASDDILSGRSTFMVEMSEANKALQNATEKSLILFDEIGRGTSTYDGMALAQAILEYIAACVHAKTLFSTHYHELTSLSGSIGCVKNVHAAVKESKDSVTFLYKIKDGDAERSYGVNVARLAGLPDAVIDRARDLQKQLESTKRVVQQSYELVEMNKEDPHSEAVMKKLKEINPDELSPRAAWEMLSDLREEAVRWKEN